MKSDSVVRVSVIQAASVLFDREASVEKACRLIAEAAARGSRLILLPEAFIPAYPRGFSFGMTVGSRTEDGRRLWERYWRNSVEIPGPATARLAETAREHEVYVAIVSPFGDVISGPLVGEEGILTADIDMAEVLRARLDFDVAGHYARPDIFQLTVNEQPMPGVVYS